MITNRIVIILLVLNMSYAIARDDVLMKGVVRDSSGTGIASACVRLKKYPHIYVLTDNNGAFTLAGNTNSSLIHTNSSQNLADRISASTRFLSFTTAKEYRRLDIELYDCRGVLVANKKISDAKSGVHVVTIQGFSVAPGVYLCRIYADGATMVVPLCITGTKATWVFQYAAARRQVLRLNDYSEKSVDTLLIYKKGYRNRFVVITDYVKDGIICTTQASRQWKPSGNIVHERGMVRISAKGYDFEMGQPERVVCNSNFSNEQPIHTVNFTSDFWMDTTEVTQKAYSTIMKSSYKNYIEPVWLAEFGLGDKKPAYTVSWGDAVLYANAMSRHENLDTVYTYTGIEGDLGSLCILKNVSSTLAKNGYRLPTEAEWEYACRAGTTTDYYWGKECGKNYPATHADSMEISSYVIWRVNSLDLPKGSGFGNNDVATKKPNQYGLYDMCGNSSEWCHDWLGDYSIQEQTDPTGPKIGDVNVLRGGNWGDDAAYLRSTNRTFDPANYPYYFFGFRLVKRIF